MRRKMRNDAQRASSCLSLAGGAATSAALDRKKAPPMQERPGSLGRKRPRRAVVLATPSRARQGSIYPVQCSKQGRAPSAPHKFVRM